MNTLKTIELYILKGCLSHYVNSISIKLFLKRDRERRVTKQEWQEWQQGKKRGNRESRRAAARGTEKIHSQEVSKVPAHKAVRQPQFLLIPQGVQCNCYHSGKEFTQEMPVQSLGWEDPLEKETATHSHILAWKTAWTEEPGGLQSLGSQSQTLSD